MQHKKYKIVPAKSPKKVAVIGGGIGGMECALVLKKRGHTPVIFEKGDKLGGLYITAAAMSFKDADKRLLGWYERELSKAGVEIRLRTPVEDPAALVGDFDEVIVCTGSKPKTLPIPGFEKTLTFTQLLLGESAGDKVVFLGGGQSACEAAYELSLQGKHPVIVEMANDLITAPGTCLANSSFLRDVLAFRKVPVYLKSTITDIRDGAVTVKGGDGKTFDLACDSVVNAVGFDPAPLGDAKDRHIHRVGTCVSWGNLRNVIWNAWDVCMKL